jgi:hypothetical protein
MVALAIVQRSFWRIVMAYAPLSFVSFARHGRLTSTAPRAASKACIPCMVLSCVRCAHCKEERALTCLSPRPERQQRLLGFCE